MASKTSTGIQYSERTMNGIIDINADTITSNTINSNTITADNLLEADVAETITANKWSFVYPPNLINLPLDANDAANKGYVDTAISTINLTPYQLTATNTLTNLLARSTYGGGYGMTSMGTITIGQQSTLRTTIGNIILTNKNYNGTTDDFIIMDNTTGINALIVAKYVKNAPVKIFGVDIGQNIITGYDTSTLLPLRIVSLNGVKITIGAYDWLFKTDGTLSFPDASIQSTAFIPANYYTSSYIDSNFYTSTYIDSNFLTTAIAAFTYQPVIDMVNYYTKVQADALFLSNPSLVDIIINGINAGRGLSNNSSNTAFGSGSLTLTTSAIHSTMVGATCGDALTSGSYNSGFGSGALSGVNTGVGNTGIGRNALYSNTSANYNTSLGYASAYYNTGSNNTYLGAYAAFYKSSGNNNTCVGYQSMYSGGIYNTTSNQTAVGAYSLYSFQSSSIQNTCVGFESLKLLTFGSNNSCVGHASGSNLTTGSQNCCFGGNTMLYKQQSNGCVAIGFNALAGVSPAIAGSYNNTGVGYNCLALLTTGNYCTSVGAYALYNNNIGYENTAIGEGAGYRATSSTRCTYLGRNADNYTTIQFTNSTAVGYGATITASDRVFLGDGNSCVVQPGGYLCKAGRNATTWGNVFNLNWTGSAWEVYIDTTRVYNSSDYRLKENFTEPKPVLDRLCGVKMIEYEFKDIGIYKKGGRMLGVLAHELGEAFPELDSVVMGKKDDVNEAGEIQPQGIHEKHTMLFMKAIQELNAKVEAQQKQIDLLLSIIKSNGIV